MSLAGCATFNQALSIKGACDSFQAPKFAVKGKTRPDQLWVDDTTESGIAACKWQRPKPRPPMKTIVHKAEFVPVRVVPIEVSVEAQPAAAPIPPPASVTWWLWFRRLIGH